MLRKGIVESFASNYVNIEVNGKVELVERNYVENDVEVGDVVVFQDDLWQTDREETQKRTQYMKQLMEDVWED